MLAPVVREEVRSDEEPQLALWLPAEYRASASVVISGLSSFLFFNKCLHVQFAVETQFRSKPTFIIQYIQIEDLLIELICSHKSSHYFIL